MTFQGSFVTSCLSEISKKMLTKQLKLGQRFLYPVLTLCEESSYFVPSLTEMFILHLRIQPQSNNWGVDYRYTQPCNRARCQDAAEKRSIEMFDVLASFCLLLITSCSCSNHGNTGPHGSCPD